MCIKLCYLNWDVIPNLSHNTFLRPETNKDSRQRHNTFLCLRVNPLSKRNKGKCFIKNDLYKHSKINRQKKKIN